jgi:hypothetical protein
MGTKITRPQHLRFRYEQRPHLGHLSKQLHNVNTGSDDADAGTHARGNTRVASGLAPTMRNAHGILQKPITVFHSCSDIFNVVVRIHDHGA